jgi:hypothetical protein
MRGGGFLAGLLVLGCVSVVSALETAGRRRRLGWTMERRSRRDRCGVHDGDSVNGAEHQLRDLGMVQ